MAGFKNPPKSRVGDGTPGPGRPKGLPNKATAEVRAAIAKLMEETAPKMQEWLDRVADEDPARALEIVVKLAEYHIPKLGRTEVGFDGAGVEQVRAVINVTIGP
jgi:hypothetical protein